MKALLIGLGGVGQRHARNLRTVLQDGLQLLACRVRGLKHVITPQLQADTGLDVEETLGIVTFNSLDSALEQRPDIAFICNPTSLHVPVAMACINAGCDIFVEKPLSHSSEGVELLIAAAQERQRIGMVGYQLRFHPCVNALASIIASAQLGRILSVRAVIGEDLRKWHPYEDFRQSYAAKTDLGGGVVGTQAHELDYLYSFFGLPRKIFAIGGHWSHLEIDVEDTASILMESSFKDRPLAIHLHQDYLQYPAFRQCEIIGDCGKAIMDLPKLTVTIERYDGSQPTVHAFPNFDRNQLFIAEIRHFLDCVKNRTRPIVDLRDGQQSLMMALAAKESIATGDPILLDSRMNLLSQA